MQPIKYESLGGSSPHVRADEAVMRGIAPDKGLYKPERIPRLPDEFWERARNMEFREIAFEMVRPFFGADIPEDKLREICNDAFNFPIPLVEVQEKMSALELYHGPTAAFKDFGARFMSRVLGYFAEKRGQDINILVATSGDTGSAVADGFLNVPGIKVTILYPKGKVSPLQEAQLTTMGGNITAFEVDGVFDDCQRMVNSAFVDPELRNKMALSSANSINIARLIPQMTYYAYLATRYPKGTRLAVSVPSGNLGNLTAGVYAKAMGAPIERFIASTNENDALYRFLTTGQYDPHASVQTISNAMDVGNPNNFPRLRAHYGGKIGAMRKDIYPARVTDDETRSAIADIHWARNYVMDPHGAVAYAGLLKFLSKNPEYQGVFLVTAHPAKFAEVVEPAIGESIEIPARLAAFLGREKVATSIPADFDIFKEKLLEQVA